MLSTGVDVASMTCFYEALNYILKTSNLPGKLDSCNTCKIYIQLDQDQDLFVLQSKTVLMDYIEVQSAKCQNEITVVTKFFIYM